MFLLGRMGEMSKSVVFLCVFARSRGGHVEKCRVFVCFCSAEGLKCRKVSCFCVFCDVDRSLGVEASSIQVHNLLFNI